MTTPTSLLSSQFTFVLQISLQTEAHVKVSHLHLLSLWYAVLTLCAQATYFYSAAMMLSVTDFRGYVF